MSSIEQQLKEYQDRVLEKLPEKLAHLVVAEELTLMEAVAINDFIDEHKDKDITYTWKLRVSGLWMLLVTFLLGLWLGRWLL